jgi:hypothetical protein
MENEDPADVSYQLDACHSYFISLFMPINCIHVM